MAITTDHIPTLTIDDLDYITSSMATDTITWGAAADCVTTGTLHPNYGAVPGPTTTIGGGTGYTYTTDTTSPWIATGTNPAMVVNQSGSIEIKGEDADIKINGKSMKTWMEAVEERLNISHPILNWKQTGTNCKNLVNATEPWNGSAKKKHRCGQP
jgi:hypothetical protein